MFVYLQKKLYLCRLNEMYTFKSIKNHGYKVKNSMF